MYERMLDLSEEPAYEEMTAHCRKAGTLFERLNTALEGETGTPGRIRNPYGKKYGWGVEHRKGTKHVCDVFPEKGALVLMLRLSNADFEAVYPSLGDAARRAVDGRYPCGEGGWIHLRIEEERAVQDALLLAERRIHPAKKK